MPTMALQVIANNTFSICPLDVFYLPGGVGGGWVWGEGGGVGVDGVDGAGAVGGCGAVDGCAGAVGAGVGAVGCAAAPGTLSAGCVACAA